MSHVNSHALVETNWLEEHLNDTDLCLLDCRVLLLPEDSGGFRLESGRPAWETGHIPGSGFIDFVTDLSDPHSALPLMMPPAEQFADAMTRAGVSADTRVILYDDFYNIWAARVWWMLRTSGFDNCGSPQRRLAQVDAGRPARLGPPCCSHTRPVRGHPATRADGR